MCSGICRELSIFQDGVRDCRLGEDEGVTILDISSVSSAYCPGYDNGQSGRSQESGCSRSEMKCRGSGKCMPKVYPLSLRKQCLNAQTSFPHHLTRTKCPSFYTCKQTRRDISRNNGTICLNQKEICDGIPQCPYWDDEASCSHMYCPQGCSRCSYNRFRCPSSAFFDIPSNALSIDVSDQYVKIEDVCFIRRLRLLSLNLSNCNLSDIRCVTIKFPNLRYLDVSYNNLETPSIVSQNIRYLRLDGNPLNILTHYCIVSLRHISAKNTRLQTFISNYNRKSRHFQVHFHNNWRGYSPLNYYLESVDFRENKIESIRFLDRFSNIRSADVSKNKIRYLGRLFFLYYLTRFIAHDNLLVELTNLTFEAMYRLEILDLSRNRIKTITSNIFENNVRLRELYLQSNLLKKLAHSLFKSLINLEVLRLDNNYIGHLPSDIFYHQAALRTLNLKNNNIKIIPKRLFRHTASLRLIDISGNNIHVYEDMFYGLVLEKLIVDRFSLCCAKPKSVTVENCHAPSITISSCQYLLKAWPLGICLWYLTILIFTGNIFTIYRRLTDKDVSNKWNKTFTVNMSIADILIGMYTFSIGLKDVGNKGKYGLVHDEWIRAWQCSALQFLSSTSLEATMILSVIASNWKPNPSFDLNRFKLKIAVLVAWVLSIAFASAYFSWNMLTSHGVSMSPQLCMAIPIIYHLREDHIDGSQYTTWMFVWLIVHSSCSLVIASAESWKMLRGPKRKRDVQQTIIVTSVAVRDLFICITAILQMEVTIPDAFHELTLLLIATCSAIGTLARFLLKTSNDIVIVLSDQKGWKQTIRKIKILRHMVICESPIPKSDVHLDVGKLTARILNKTNNTCIAQSSLKCEPQSGNTAS